MAISFGRDMLIFYWPGFLDDIGLDPIRFLWVGLVHVLSGLFSACYWLRVSIFCQYIFRMTCDVMSLAWARILRKSI